MTRQLVEQPTRTEAEILNGIMLRYGREPDLTLYRQNTGVARSEIATRAHLERLFALLTTARTEHQLRANVTTSIDLLRALLAESPRFTPFGLCVGSSDIIGIVESNGTVERYGFTDPFTQRITVGRMLALEVKRPGKNPTADQQAFLDLVNRRGGVGRCVHSEDEAGAAIEEARAL